VVTRGAPAAVALRVRLQAMLGRRGADPSPLPPAPEEVSR
jgi:hypothetical protein